MEALVFFIISIPPETTQDAERHKHSERHSARCGGVPYSCAEGKVNVSAANAVVVAH